MTPAQSNQLDKRAVLLHMAALEFFARHRGEHLAAGQAPLLERCIAHLVDTGEVSRATAEHAALQALGERAASATGLYIDCSATTSYVLHLVDSRTRKRYVIQLAELVETLPGLP